MIGAIKKEFPVGSEVVQGKPGKRIRAKVLGYSDMPSDFGLCLSVKGRVFVGNPKNWEPYVESIEEG